ncbi:MAG: 23S rRNA (adenine(2503)-C(2))-methyltransferase RlmN [Deltaproteobacteria bacterium]|nr:23S rRNA (adenine(2503)-C(2))-methyltransferase RlmN [Deltaproteobacteria bacterium]
MATADFDERDPLAWLPEDWQRFLAEQGQRTFRAAQVFRWIHGRGVADPARMTDLGKPLRSAIEKAGLAMPAVLDQVHRSDDGTKKALVRFTAGGVVETVLIPPLAQDASEQADMDELDEGAPQGLVEVAAHEPVAKKGPPQRKPPRRVTQCISSQVGCAMGCVFCASGIAGLKRNLTAGEIVAQVLLGRQELDSDEALRNVVLMGMGEPLHNYGNVSRTLALLLHQDGINLSNRRVTVSTSGLVPEIDRLGEEFKGQVSLAISLHAPDDSLRTSLMPINKRYPLKELIASLVRYPMTTRRKITIEYTLIRDVNDSDQQARALAKLLRPVPCKLNLIPMNPVEGSPFTMPSMERVEAFQSRLRAEGYTVFVRKQRGDDIDAACGQLALSKELAAKNRRVLPVISQTQSNNPMQRTTLQSEGVSSDG